MNRIYQILHFLSPSKIPQELFREGRTCREFLLRLLFWLKIIGKGQKGLIHLSCLKKGNNISYFWFHSSALQIFAGFSRSTPKMIMYTPTLNTTRYAVPDVGQLNALRHKSGYLHTVTPMCPSPREWSTPSQTKPTRQISFTRLSSFSTQNANCCVSSLGDLPSSRIDALFSWYSRSKPWFSTFFM